MMFSPDNYTETDALIYELQQEIEIYRGQLVTLFERVSGCEVSEFDSEQVNYLADMIEGQMDADEGAISKLKKENAELREHLANLVTESIALAQFKNDTLRKNICSTDLDEPEWHDYQTIGEAGALLEKLKVSN